MSLLDAAREVREAAYAPYSKFKVGAAVRAALLEHYPAYYQEMPLTTALYKLYNTARVYKDDVTLIDPPSGETWPTIQPRA